MNKLTVRVTWSGSRWLLGLLLTCTVLATVADVARGQETSEARNARMHWWREAKFGMFIHWGLYAVPAGEWNGRTNYGEWFLEETKMPVSQYEQYAKEFNPVKFDAKEWVKIAKDAGMKYIVITSKHHDGFGMYPSKLTDWCIKSTPFQRDPLRELSEACQEAGLRFCVYHSIMDWHHPDWGTRRAWNDTATGTPDMNRFSEYLKGQVTELVTNYHPGVLWFDGEWESPWTHERGVELYKYLRKLDPNLIINNRIDKARDGMAGMTTSDAAVGDFGTPEQQIPASGFGPGVDWESCMTLNNHWGYNKHDQNWKSTETVVRNLIDIASKGGNYLLNVGPTGEGLIPDGSVQCLKEVGTWMKINGEAICDTSASPFRKQLAWGRCTAKPGKLFLHVFDWPADGTLSVPILNKVTRAYLLTAPQETLKVATREGAVDVQLPAKAPDAIASVVVVELPDEPQLAPPTPLTATADGTLQLSASDAEIVGPGGAKLEGEPERNVGFWTNAGDFLQWYTKIDKAGKFEVLLNYACEPGSAGSEYAVTAGTESVTGQIEATKSWRDYKTIPIGTLEIAQPSALTITLKATKKPGLAVMNVRSVTLKRKQ